jgi:hypothetical protein
MPSSSRCSRGFRTEDLDFASRNRERLLADFADRELGGFWFTASGAGPAALRPKALRGRRHASGNGVAAQALAAPRLADGRSALSRRRGGRGPRRLPVARARAGAPCRIAQRARGVPRARPRSWWFAEAARTRRVAGGARPRVRAAPHGHRDPGGATGLPEAIANKTPRGRTVAYVCPRAGLLGTGRELAALSPAASRP